jgi:hypothetical protein
MICLAMIMLGVSASEMYKEKQKTERYTACIRELKDIEKCKKGK